MCQPSPFLIRVGFKQRRQFLSGIVSTSDLFPTTVGFKQGSRSLSGIILALELFPTTVGFKQRSRFLSGIVSISDHSRTTVGPQSDSGSVYSHFLLVFFSDKAVGYCLESFQI